MKITFTAEVTIAPLLAPVARIAFKALTPEDMKALAQQSVCDRLPPGVTVNRFTLEADGKTFDVNIG